MFTIHADSHIDHGVPNQVIEWAQQYLSPEVAESAVRGLDGHIESFEKSGPDRLIKKVTLILPSWAADLQCELIGPATGTEEVPEVAVTYRVRGERKCASRMAYVAPMPTRKLTLIAGPHDGQPCVLFTIFGGPGAPREPGDPSIQTWEELQESKRFWATHALALPAEAAEAKEALTDVILADRAKQVERLSQAISLLEKADELAVRALDDGDLEGVLMMSYVAIRQQIDTFLR